MKNIYSECNLFRTMQRGKVIPNYENSQTKAENMNYEVDMFLKAEFIND